MDIHNEAIKQQIAVVEGERKQTLEALNKLYDLDIIYPKYRSLMAVSMFCEYYDTGRRTVLSGINGMYDLYETELASQKIIQSLSEVNKNLGTIVYKLDTISSQLRHIAGNQYLVYMAVAQGNEIARTISEKTSSLISKSASMVSKMDDVEKTLSGIKAASEKTAHNSEMAAYNSEMIAYNTEATSRRVNAMAKIEEYEFSLRHPAFPSV